MFTSVCVCMCVRACECVCACVRACVGVREYLIVGIHARGHVFMYPCARKHYTNESQPQATICKVRGLLRMCSESGFFIEILVDIL